MDHAKDVLLVLLTLPQIQSAPVAQKGLFRILTDFRFAPNAQQEHFNLSKVKLIVRTAQKANSQ
jgi:hypothetical protein